VKKNRHLLPQLFCRCSQANKNEVTDFLRAEFGATPVIKYAGSREKGTMIQENYDLDIVCYFPSSDRRSLKEIRADVSSHLAKRYSLEERASAERILNLKGATAPHSYHIDVVPGRFIEDSKDVFLHVAYGDKERMRTNLKTHIDHIVNSGCVEIIRLTKLWARRNSVNIKTFVLELFVIETLSGTGDKDNLKESFRSVLEAFMDRFETIQLVDPANGNNIVSRLVSAADKSATTQAAKESFNKIDSSDSLDDWKAIFHEDDSSNYSSSPITAPNIIRNPSRPWAY